MKKLFLTGIILICFQGFSQSFELGMNYFDKGEFEKATQIFEEIHQKTAQPNAAFYKLIASYQQLQQYDKAEKALHLLMSKYKNPVLYVEYGYNYQKQKNEIKATEYYNLAIEQIAIQSNYASTVAYAFEQKSLLEWAIKSYEVGVLGNPNLNFDYQIALLQGQLGKLDVMIEKLLDYAYANENGLATVQYQLTRFLTEDTQETFNDLLKKALLLRVQKTQDVFWNRFLSWYFVAQKEYAKAFIQEKAIYKRNPESFSNIIQLAKLAKQDQDIDTAKTIYGFVLENTQDLGLQIEAHHFLIKTEMEFASPNAFPDIKAKLDLLLKQYGVSPYTLSLQLLSAHFDAFYLNAITSAQERLQQALQLPLSLRQICEVKMELGDILLFDDKFNQASLYYAQISEDLKNDVMAHEASFKMAKATYYKQDFDWAMQQVKVLKQSTSLLIANDALELFLHIEDNIEEDSLRIAIKDFSKADLLQYKRKNDDALKLFLTILEHHKGNAIEDETLLVLGKIYEQNKQYDNALLYYQKILDEQKESIYRDEAWFYAAEIYRKFVPNIEKAKQYYERIVFDHADSIHFTEARKQFRLLRGDQIQ